MNGTTWLHQAGQSIWLDNITRALVTSDGLARYVSDYAVTGLTSNPTIFDLAIRTSQDYDAAIRAAGAACSDEEVFFGLALDDLRRAAELFRPVHERTNRVDGWVSLELPPTLAYDTAGTIAAAADFHRRAAIPNLFIKIPGTPEGVPAIEESIFAGVPVNVTLLFSREQYVAAAEAYLRGIERRVAAGQNPHVASVASLFVSRWDAAIAGKVPATLENRLGIAIAKRAYRAYRELLASDRWLRLLNHGARSQRLLWASTGTKDPKAPPILYVDGLAAPHSVNTIPEKTLHALAEHGTIGAMLPHDGGDAEAVLGDFRRAGIDLDALAADLQRKGADAFVKSWTDLLRCIAEKRAALGTAA